MNARRSVSLLVVTLVALAACGGGDDQAEASTPTSATDAPTVTDPPTTPPATSSPLTTSPTTITIITPTTTTTTTTPTTTSAPTTTTPPSTAPLPAGFTIALPVGGGTEALTYSDDDIEVEVNGPSSFSVDDHGGVYINDPVAKRILAIRGSVQTFIDLAPLGVGWLDDIIAGDDYMIVLDLSFDETLVERVLRVSYSGELLEEIPIPAEFGVDAGAQGLLDLGDDDRTALEYLGPDVHAAEWDRATQAWSWQPSIEIGGVNVTHVNGNLQVGDHLLTVDATPPQQWWANLRFLGRAADGRWIVSRWDGAAAIEWWSGAGQFLGAAAQFSGAYVTGSGDATATTAEGRVFEMTTYVDSVVVAELLPQPDRIITP